MSDSPVGLLYQGRAEPTFAVRDGARDGWQIEQSVPVKRRPPTYLFAATVAFVAIPPGPGIQAPIAAWQPASPFFVYADEKGQGPHRDSSFVPSVVTWACPSPYFMFYDKNSSATFPPVPPNGHLLPTWLPRTQEPMVKRRAPLYVQVAETYWQTPVIPVNQWYFQAQDFHYLRPTIGVDECTRSGFKVIPTIDAWYIQPTDMAVRNRTSRPVDFSHAKIDIALIIPPIMVDQWFNQQPDLARLRRPTRVDQEHRGNLNQPFVAEPVSPNKWQVEDMQVFRRPRIAYLFAEAYQVQRDLPPPTSSFGVPIIMTGF